MTAAARPVPEPTPVSRPFWDGLTQHRILVQYSPSLQRYVFYPRILAPGTLADDLEWREIDGAGTLYTYTTQEFPPPLPYKGSRDPKVFQPYVIGFVELAEGVLVETLIVEANPAELRIGQPLVSTTTTLETADGQSLVTFAFRPASGR